MDAFVIRTKRNTSSVKRSPKKKIPSRQRTLNDLKGVVVLENLEKHVKTLNNPGVETASKIKILKNLNSKQPSTEIIVKTGIGKVVKKLCDHPDVDLANAAKLLKETWKNLVERRVELSLSDKTEVATDLETQTIREKARALLFKAYRDVKLETIQTLEKKFYQHFRPCIGNRYRKAVRKVVVNPSSYEDLIKTNQLDAIVSKATFL